jgi:ferrous-iron efflux pump FieF
VANRAALPVSATPTRAAIASVATAMFLLSLKAWAVWRTGSVALLASVADSGLDLVASLVTLWGVRVAALPADHEHRFGHGKAEALVSLVQVALVAASAVLVAWRAIGALAGTLPEAVDPQAGIFVSIGAMAVTTLLLAYQRRAMRNQPSVAIRADNLHYQNDVLLNGAVIAALILESYVGLRGADPVFGLAMAVFIGWGAYRVADTALAHLMDREWPNERRQRYLAIVASHPKVAGVHDLRTRTSGAIDFAQFHIWVDPAMTVAQAHDVMDEVEANLATEFPGVEVLIHVDPAGHVDAEGVLSSSLAEEATR